MPLRKDTDELFEGFLCDFGPAFDRVDVPESNIALYEGRLPDQLLRYWEEHGWCGYAEGMFWTVDPDAYEPALEAWIGGSPFMEDDAYHVIARGAFGNLYLWGERTGPSLMISPVGAFAKASRPAASTSLDERARMFFGFRGKRQDDFADYFAPALQKLGRLKSDEMYGFVPALALGGPSKFENLQKVKAVEHLVFLAQVSELEVMGSTPPSWIFGS